MTTINTIQDLIQLLRDQPLWAEELRGILLSTELRDLPAAVRELTQTLAANAVQTNERLTRIEQDVSILKEDVSTLKEDVSTQKGNISTLQGNMARLNGAEYERYVEDKAVHRAYANLGFIQAVPVKGPRSGFQPRLSSALARARKRAAQERRPLPDLTEENNFVNSDIIIADLGDPDDRERRSPPVAYALFEVSITADRNDLRRASARAETLAAILQVPVIPAVIADTFPETERLASAEAGVARFRIPDR